VRHKHLSLLGSHHLLHNVFNWPRYYITELAPDLNKQEEQEELERRNPRRANSETARFAKKTGRVHVHAYTTRGCEHVDSDLKSLSIGRSSAQRYALRQHQLLIWHNKQLFAVKQKSL